MSALPADDESTRSRLLRAAVEVFAERGYEGTRVQEVARRAGLTTGAIYGNFSGKSELLAEAIGTTEFDDLFRLHSQGLPSTETLARAGALLVDPNLREQRLLLFEAFVAARRDPEVAALLRARVSERAVQVAEVLDDGKADGEIDPGLDVEAAVRFCHAIALGVLLQEALDLPPADADTWGAVVRRTIRSFAPALSDTKGDP